MTVIDKSKFRQTVYELLENDDSILTFPKGNIEVTEALTSGFLEGLIAVSYDPIDNSLKWLSLEHWEELKQRDSPERMYSLIREFEIEIRRFIKSKLYESFSNLWMKRGIPKDIRKNWNMRKLDDIKQGKQTEANVEDYADFSDYHKIIIYNWKEIFSRIFEDKGKLRIRLEDLNNFCRKAIMHMRTITYSEVGLAEIAIQWLRSKMKQS
jgi:hypothetical protein